MIRHALFAVRCWCADLAYALLVACGVAYHDAMLTELDALDRLDDDRDSAAA